MRLISTDHKTIGINLGVLSLFYFLLGGLFALLMRSQLAEPNNQLLSNGTYDELFTMHGSTMIFLFVTPMALALALYLIPLQIGARTLSAPRAALCGFWLWVCGGLVMQSGWFTASGPGQDGWTSYTPLSTGSYTPGVGQDLWVLGVLLAILGMILIAICIAVTVARRRAPGMTMMRLPVFSWTALVSVLMVIGAFPMMVLVMALLYVDRLGAHIFTGFAGAVDYEDLFWFFGHPVVYVMFFPYLGAAAEAIAVGAHKRWFGYTAFVASMLAFSVLSMSVWGHHMFVTGGVTNQYFAFTSTLLLVPAGIEYFDLVGTLVGGSIVPRCAFLFGITFFIQFLIGGLSGIFLASPVLDYNAYGSYIVVAHFHYTLFAGSIFGFFAGVYHWFPKLTGRLLREGLGRVHLGLLIVGTNLTFLPMFFLGSDGMARRIARYPTHPGWAGLNQLETAGAGLIALAVAVFLLNVVVSLRRPRLAGPDPWLGHTLEWATSSPPPALNFTEPLPPIRSYAPLLDLREAADAAAAADPSDPVPVP
ncbi:cbb3-type cytochrome c oxidase subunit I [Conexibacter sp. DBS9H8]|uniref:cytochrome c oxidase subunit I n=1 Tax=Conexibacter sp. DBS9H8 TaxID=2937801 RepID=UPI00200C8828|nr:cbb3-type cytochrome c oxidase subunit I [Conexibacter sp. DBS9H8]